MGGWFSPEVSAGAGAYFSGSLRSIKRSLAIKPVLVWFRHTALRRHQALTPHPRPERRPEAA